MEAVISKPNNPPPLPPKTRRNVQYVSATTTVPMSGANQKMFSFSFPEETGIRFNSSSEPLSGTKRDVSSSSVINEKQHVVKIRINQDDANVTPNNYQSTLKLPVTFNNNVNLIKKDQVNGCIRINVSSNGVEPNTEMVRRVNSASDAFVNNNSHERKSDFFLYSPYHCAPNGMVYSSGQSSPSDTLDSGTCSDLDGSTPPPLPKKKTTLCCPPTGTVTVTVNGNHERTGSLTSSGADVDSDDDASNISCDSLNSSDLNGIITTVEAINLHTIQPIVEAINFENEGIKSEIQSEIENQVAEQIEEETVTPSSEPRGKSSQGRILPQGLLQDIRDRTAKLTLAAALNNTGTIPKKNKIWGEDTLRRTSRSPTPQADSLTATINVNKNKHQELSARLSSSSEDSLSSKKSTLVEERTYEDRKKETVEKEKMKTIPINSAGSSFQYDMDRFYKFHINENLQEKCPSPVVDDDQEDSFAGYKDILEGSDCSSTIRSAKGTVRGVKNRVRAGIATFLQLHATKSYKEKEVGKVVVYTTTMGVVRKTYHECLKVKKILRNLLVKYEERDVFMSREVQSEIRERMNSDSILVPQVFVEGQHIGDAETIERLNESGELRRLLKQFRSLDAITTCQVCGGHRLLPCSVCNGSKKSVHRNDFTAEFVALKCMNCDEVGLIKCTACC